MRYMRYMVCTVCMCCVLKEKADMNIDDRSVCNFCIDCIHRIGRIACIFQRYCR